MKYLYGVPMFWELNTAIEKSLVLNESTSEYIIEELNAMQAPRVVPKQTMRYYQTTFFCTYAEALRYLAGEVAKTIGHVDDILSKQQQRKSELEQFRTALIEQAQQAEAAGI